MLSLFLLPLHSHECPDCAAHRRMRNTRGGWGTSCAVSSPSSDSSRPPCFRPTRAQGRKSLRLCSIRAVKRLLKKSAPLKADRQGRRSLQMQCPQCGRSVSAKRSLHQASLFSSAEERLRRWQRKAESLRGVENHRASVGFPSLFVFPAAYKKAESLQILIAIF